MTKRYPPRFLLATVLALGTGCKPNLSALTQGSQAGNDSGGNDSAGNDSGGKGVGGQSAKGGTSGRTSRGGSSNVAAGGSTNATAGTSSGGASSGSLGGSTATSLGGSSTTGGMTATGGTSFASSTTSPCILPTVDAGDPPELKYDFDSASADGTHQGVPGWTAVGRIGGALSLTGENQYVELPASVLKTFNEVTIAAWVKLTANPAGAALFDIGTSTDNHFFLQTNAGTGQIALGAIVNGGAAQTTTTSYSLPTGVWKHLAVVVGSGAISLYIDGQNVSTKPISFAPSALGDTAPSGSFIGHSLTSTAQLYGQIDDFRIYGRALTREQLEVISPPGTDYVHFRFDETCGSKAYDRSDAGLVAELPSGGTFAASGKVGSALTLDGVSQYVKLPSHFLKNCAGDVTIALWLQRQSSNTFERIFNVGQSTSTVMTLTPSATGGLMQFAAKLGGAETRGSADEQILQALTASGSPQRGIWSHIGVVLKGGKGYLYHDGALASSGTDSISIKPSDLGNTTINELGRPLYVGEPSLNGTLDDLRLSCRAYSLQEMRILALVDKN